MNDEIWPYFVTRRGGVRKRSFYYNFQGPPEWMKEWEDDRVSFSEAICQETSKSHKGGGFGREWTYQAVVEWSCGLQG